MKKIVFKRWPTAAAVLIVQLLLLIVWGTSVNAAETNLINVREGLHADHSRIVLDCQGALPSNIGPARSDSISVTFVRLRVGANLERISHRLRGAVRRIEFHDDNGGGTVTLSYRDSDARTKSYLLESDKGSGDGYRVVIDVRHGLLQ